MNERIETLRVTKGDLTRQATDAIVNAANETLAHGGGVAAAIVRAGGSVIQEESDTWVRENGPLESGTAAVTTAGSLPARWVVHVAGPRFRSHQDNEALLRSAVAAALSAAANEGAATIALPAISAGIFGYPLEEATSIIVQRSLEWITENPGVLTEIRLVGYDDAAVAAFEKALS